MTRLVFEARDKIIEGTFSEPIDVEAVCRAINEDPECLKNAEITNGDGSLKLRNGDLVFLEILREKLKNKKSVGRVVTDAVLETYAEEYQDEGEEVLKVALEKYDEYYVKNLAEDQVSREGRERIRAVVEGTKSETGSPNKKNTSEVTVVQKPRMGRRFNNPIDGAIERVLSIPVGAYHVATSERAQKMMGGIAEENIESFFLEAMSNNDETRLKFMARQIANHMVLEKHIDVDVTWSQRYETTMRKKFGEEFPPMISAEGWQMFILEVYVPILAHSLAAAEIASITGDSIASQHTLAITERVEIDIAESAARVAEKTQPARQRREVSRITADAEIAQALVDNEHVFTEAKRVGSKLVAKTVAQPVFSFFGQLFSSAVEVLPSTAKGNSMSLSRWMDEKNVDKKLVGVTAGGIGFGVVGGTIAAVMTGAWLYVPFAALAVPVAASSIYMGVKGFVSK